MSSPPQVILTNIQQGDYMSLIVLTAVGYDYVLTFSKEIEYIWNKPWTWVSTLFILVRYFGLFSFIIPMLIGTSFLPGPAKMYVFIKSLSELPDTAGEIIAIIYGWSFSLFLCPADFVMILRVWVIYNQSRLILGILLVLLSLEIISMIIAAAIYSNPNNLSGATIQILNVSFCIVQTTPQILIWTYVSAILQVTLGGVMCMLVIIQFARQSFQMYSMNKQWQLNRYMNLLIKEGILYFLGILLYNIVNVLFVAGMTPAGGWQMTLLFIMEFVPMYTLTPRFIISIRELYARDVQGGRGGGIDTGFGLSSLSSRGAVGTEIVFANAEEDVEDIPMDAGMI